MLSRHHCDLRIFQSYYSVNRIICVEHAVGSCQDMVLRNYGASTLTSIAYPIRLAIFFNQLDLPRVLIDCGILTSHDPVIVMSDGSVGFSAVAGGAGACAGAGAGDISRCP